MLDFFAFLDEEELVDALAESILLAARPALFSRSGPFVPRAFKSASICAASSLDFGAGDDVAIDFGDNLFDNTDVGGGRNDRTQ